MDLDYAKLLDEAQQLYAELDAQLEENADDEDLIETQKFLADRQKSLLFLFGD